MVFLGKNENQCRLNTPVDIEILAFYQTHKTQLLQICIVGNLFCCLESLLK